MILMLIVDLFFFVMFLYFYKWKKSNIYVSLVRTLERYVLLNFIVFSYFLESNKPILGIIFTISKIICSFVFIYLTGKKAEIRTETYEVPYDSYRDLSDDLRKKLDSTYEVYELSENINMYVNSKLYVNVIVEMYKDNASVSDYRECAYKIMEILDTYYYCSYIIKGLRVVVIISTDSIDQLKEILFEHIDIRGVKSYRDTLFPVVVCDGMMYIKNIEDMDNSVDKKKYKMVVELLKAKEKLK